MQWYVGGKTGKARKYGDNGLLFSVSWQRVVLDEGQVIKNPRTRVAQAAWALRASHRWILSGTPIQNSVNDLYSYFRFLKWAPFDKQATFKSQIADIVKNQPTKGFKKLQHILQVLLSCAVLLRVQGMRATRAIDLVCVLPCVLGLVKRGNFTVCYNALIYKPMKKTPNLASPASSQSFQRNRCRLQGVLLRRMKTMTLDGKPIIDLPECTHKQLSAEFSAEEQAFYDKLKEQSKEVVKDLKDNSGGCVANNQRFPLSAFNNMNFTMQLSLLFPSSHAGCCGAA